jgi:hypothetical protein
VAHWAITDIRLIELDTDGCDGEIVTANIHTPLGVVSIIGALDIEGRTLFVRNAHIQSQAGANDFGIAKLRVMAQAELERIDCDEVRIEGAARTTGANPGHRPGPLRFTR